jgi:hypothetical protein
MKADEVSHIRFVVHAEEEEECHDRGRRRRHHGTAVSWQSPRCEHWSRGFGRPGAPGAEGELIELRNSQGFAPVLAAVNLD